MGKPETLPSRGKQARNALPKAKTGISGLDEITLGGLPKGRPTLICGSAGCGKTLFGLEFLLRGAQEFGENGVFMAFEETEEDLAQNVRSLGFDTTSKACSCAWAWRSTRSAPSAWCWTRWRPCSAASTTRVCCAPRSAACSAG
jgi:predicted ATP-dependent serine protease